MAKRQSLRGKGADVFLVGSDQPEAPQRAKEEKRAMATFYLPPALIETLDQVWLDRRRTDKKVQKSHIVQEALERYFQTE
jgi:hypothetical protein